MFFVISNESISETKMLMITNGKYRHAYKSMASDKDL